MALDWCSGSVIIPPEPSLVPVFVSETWRFKTRSCFYGFHDGLFLSHCLACLVGDLYVTADNTALV